VLADVDTQSFLHATGGFLLAADPAQLQLNPPMLVALCKAYALAATRAHGQAYMPLSLGAGDGAPAAAAAAAAAAPRLYSALGAVAPLRRAAEQLLAGRAGVGRSLTAMDADALQLCVLGGAYSCAARHVAALDVVGVDPKHSLLTPDAHLRWWHCAGLAHCGLKQWRLAAQCFLTCVTAPATVLSAVAVAAYKKLCVVALLAHGAKAALPPHTASAVSRGLKGVSKAYDAMAAKFEANDAEGLRAACEAARGELVADKCWGLAMQALRALTQRRIARLSTCYLTLSLADIATQVGLAAGGASDAEAEVVAMVRAGAIVAAIDQRTGMVTFADDASDASGGGSGGVDAATASARETASKLEAMTRACVALGARVEALDAEMAQSAAFLKHAASRVGGGGGGGGGGGSAAFMGSDFDPDELELAEQASLQDVDAMA
jgi:COP9 signalosome complex subunit 3